MPAQVYHLRIHGQPRIHRPGNLLLGTCSLNPASKLMRWMRQATCKFSLYGPRNSECQMNPMWHRARGVPFDVHKCKKFFVKRLVDPNGFLLVPQDPLQMSSEHGFLECHWKKKTVLEFNQIRTAEGFPRGGARYGSLRMSGAL